MHDLTNEIVRGPIVIDRSSCLFRS